MEQIMTEHRNVYAALAAAQSEMDAAVKGSVNPAFKSRYADLADVVQACRTALNKNGLAFFHQMVSLDGQLAMRTVVAHGASDTTIECDVPLIVSKQDMQGMKSATTYAKRIGLESVTGIAPEDDDGNAAAKAPPATEPARTAPKNEPNTAATEAVSYLSASVDLADLQSRWRNLPISVQAIPTIIAAKDRQKVRLTQVPVSADLGGDAIPY
jgi:hypothetical protein